MKAAVVCPGFIGVVHVDALRYPTVRDGHAGNVLCDAVALSHRERRWVEVPE